MQRKLEQRIYVTDVANIYFKMQTGVTGWIDRWKKSNIKLAGPAKSAFSVEILHGFRQLTIKYSWSNQTVKFIHKEINDKLEKWKQEREETKFRTSVNKISYNTVQRLKQGLELANFHNNLKQLYKAFFASSV